MAWSAIHRGSDQVTKNCNSTSSVANLTKDSGSARDDQTNLGAGARPEATWLESMARDATEVPCLYLIFSRNLPDRTCASSIRHKIANNSFPD